MKGIRQKNWLKSGEQQNINSPIRFSSAGALMATPNKTTKKTAKILEFILINDWLGVRSVSFKLNDNTSFDYFSIYTKKEEDENTPKIGYFFSE